MATGAGGFRPPNRASVLPKRISCMIRSYTGLFTVEIRALEVQCELIGSRQRLTTCSTAQCQRSQVGSSPRSSVSQQSRQSELCLLLTRMLR